MRKLPLPTQTLYAELLEMLTALETRRSIGYSSGCFTVKEVKGERYYYFQHSDPGGRSRQTYVGKKSPALEKIVARHGEQREALQPDEEQVRRLCAQLRAGGALRTDSASGRVLAALANSGLFHLGGVLVGAHAFTVLGNLLGVQWEAGTLKTQDIDIAGESRLRIAVPDLQTDIPKALASLEMGFLPVPALNPKAPSTSFKVRGSALRVDFLTPQSRREATAPIFIRRFNVAAQPIPWLGYVLEQCERGAVVNGGGVLVNVPNPARFAFHKLMVSGARQVSAAVKGEKDLRQAAQLFSALAQDHPGDLLLAWEEIERRGKTWVQRVASALPRLARSYGTDHERLLAAMPRLRTLTSWHRP
jgi:hypothetical protein